MSRGLSLILWVAGLLLVSKGLGMLSNAGMQPWYALLEKSPLTPPGYVFGVVWTLLYITIATAGWYLWSSPKTATLPKLKKLFAIQLVLNWAWTPLFFYFHLITVPLVCLIAIVVFTLALILSARERYPLVSFLLLPYFIWLCFATYLNAYIFFVN